MHYNIVQPPFTHKLREMPEHELKQYFAWFIEMLPQRIAELTKEVCQTPGFENWNSDYTPSSLEGLGKWFAIHVETRNRTHGELETIRSKQIFPIEVPGEELTNLTFSLAMDIGMYLSQVFLRNHSSLEWQQPLRDKKFVDFGQPVLEKFTSAPFNPVRMVVTLAYGLVSKNKTGQDLRNIYEIWAKMVVPTKQED